MELEKLNKKTLSLVVEDLAEQVIMWQEQYNKAAFQVEKLTEKRQLKVIMLSKEELIEETINRHENEKNIDF